MVSYEYRRTAALILVNFNITFLASSDCSYKPDWDNCTYMCISRSCLVDRSRLLKKK